MTSPQTLSDWLAHIERTHTQTIDMGLARVAAVRDRMAADTDAVVITVGGTNGKGSTCAMLENILKSAGYRVGLYTSPHLIHYNERVRIDGEPVSDARLIEGFKAVEAVRGDTPLTYFEFGTLCAWQVFCAQPLDAIILEVGLGGRLDAVNIFEPDCSIVTSVDLDHQQYLGDTREAIGFEKAHIFRAGKPAVVGDPMPPQSLIDHARAIGATLLVSGRDFGFSGDRQQWSYQGRIKRGGMAYPALRGANQLLNAAAVITALDCLREDLPLAMSDIRHGLMTVELPGRFQVLPGRPVVVLDVAHNPQAAAVLNENLSNMGYHPESWAVFGILADKDVDAVIRTLATRFDHWLCVDLPGPRALSGAALAQKVSALTACADVRVLESPLKALETAKALASVDDRIAVFGSFLTVAGVMAEGAAAAN
jgi:dihydrofolate synthase/folylpolyglutamate synthase